MVVPTAKEAELADQIVRSQVQLRIEGHKSHGSFRIASSGDSLSVCEHEGVVEHQPADMVVTVRAGTSLLELQSELGTKNQCVPWLPLEGFPQGTVGGAIAMALPHPMQSRFGSWRDWVLGLKLLLADGTVVKCGSRAVKNVAGYDVQKLIVGSRGSLAVILEATLRTWPRLASGALPETVIHGNAGALRSIQRTLRTDFDAALEASRASMLFACPETATLWLSGPPERRFPGDWVIRSGCGHENVLITDPTQIRLMKHAKRIFDPGNKLNPGEWGFI
jgi:glycolate oxidase FAD binding subunit